MKTIGPSAFRLLQNVTIMGPPGSGKGFYGRLLAQAWDVPLITTSTVLRSATDSSGSLDLDSGRLVDCQTVSNLLWEYLEQNQHDKHYILDGFPRTALQIELMQSQWPKNLQVHAALHLDIPDEVCIQKSLGRRHCSLCASYVNLANVQIGQFDLPPTFPKECQYKDKENVHPSRPCHTHWTTRKDDTDEIIRERLRLHHTHQDPIVDYYRSSHRLLQVTPYKGLCDVPLLQQTCEEWLRQHPAEQSL